MNPHVNQPGDKQEQEINMPVGKNDLMLLSMALLEFKNKIKKNHSDRPSAAKFTLLTQLSALEAKIISNEISWNSLYGS